MPPRFRGDHNLLRWFELGPLSSRHARLRQAAVGGPGGALARCRRGVSEADVPGRTGVLDRLPDAPVGETPLREHRSASEWVSDALAMTCGYGGASNACLTVGRDRDPVRPCLVARPGTTPGQPRAHHPGPMPSPGGHRAAIRRSSSDARDCGHVSRGTEGASVAQSQLCLTSSASRPAMTQHPCYSSGDVRGDGRHYLQRLGSKIIR